MFNLDNAPIWAKTLFLSLCDESGHLPASMGKILIYATDYVIEGLILMFSIFGLAVLAFKCLRSAFAPDGEEKKGKKAFKERHSAFTATVMIGAATFSLICSVGMFLAKFMQIYAVSETVSQMYAGMASELGKMTFCQALLAVLAIMQDRNESLDDAIRSRVLPAVRKTLNERMPKETADAAFDLTYIIITDGIRKRAWRRELKVTAGAMTGKDALHLVLDIMYSPHATRQGAPYKAICSDNEKKIIDQIKLHVFQYPSLDAPWRFED